MGMHADEFAGELQSVLLRAEECGFVAVDVSAENLYRRLSGYPEPHDRMPMCCDVMRSAMLTGDTVVQEPPDGHGPELVIRYHLPRYAS